MKFTMKIGNKLVEREGISCGAYEDFIEIRDTVNPDGEYSREDMKTMRKGLCIVFAGQVTEEELREADAEDVIYNFMAVDASIAAGLQKRVEKMKADFGIGE